MLAKGALRRLDRLGPGRDRRGARARRHVRKPYRGHDGRRRRAQRRADGRVRRRRARPPRSSGWRRSACRSTRASEARWHLTREGGHSHRRIVHVADATGWAVQQALEKAAAEHPNIKLIPDMVAIDLVTGRHGERYSGDGRVWGVYALNRETGQVETVHRPRHDPRHRRRGPRLALFDRPARLDRRRHRHGLAGGLPGVEHGVQPVPPDLPLQS